MYNFLAIRAALLEFFCKLKACPVLTLVPTCNKQVVYLANTILSMLYMLSK